MRSASLKKILLPKNESYAVNIGDENRRERQHMKEHGFLCEYSEHLQSRLCLVQLGALAISTLTRSASKTCTLNFDSFSSESSRLTLHDTLNVRLTLEISDVGAFARVIPSRTCTQDAVDSHHFMTLAGTRTASSCIFKAPALFTLPSPNGFLGFASSTSNVCICDSA